MVSIVRSFALLSVLLPGSARAGEAEPLAALPARIGGTVETLPVARRIVELVGAREPAVVIETKSVGGAASDPWWDGAAPTLGVLRFDLPDARERERFRERFGFESRAIPVARAAVAIVVAPGNPVGREGLTLAELHRIFGRRGPLGAELATHWGDLSAPQALQQLPIAAHGHEAGAGLHDFFRLAVLEGDDDRDDLVRHPSSDAVARAVASASGAVGYAARPFVGGLAEIVPLVPRDGAMPVAPDARAVADGSYPLVATLHLVVPQPEGEPLRDATRAVLEAVFAPEGAAALEALGFVPLPPEQVRDLATRHGFALAAAESD